MARLSEPLVLALDVGSSSVRAILHDARGAPVKGAAAQRAYEPRSGQDGTAEVPPAQLLGLVERTIDEALEGRREEVAAVAVSTFWHGLMGLRGGRPLTPVWLWSDSRSWREAEALREQVDGEEIRQRTGCPIHPSYWPAKLKWAGAATAEHWCSFGDYFYLRLFRELSTSLSMASGTGILALRRPEWDEGMLDLLELHRDQLPEIGEEGGRLTGAYARRWPQLARARWFNAAGDGACANLGSGCVDPNLRAVTIGTSAAIRVTASELPSRLPEGLWCYRLDARRVILGGAFSTGGNFHAWVIQNFRAEANDMERRIARMPAAGHGLLLLPLLAGERSPGYATRARGAIAGLTLATTPADIMRAGMEAIGIAFARVDGRLDQGAPGAQLLVASGAALLASPAWMQILADSVGKPLVRVPYQEASCRGAAIFALEMLGVSVPQRLPRGRTFSPDAAAHAIYEGEVRRQDRLYQALVVDGLADGGTSPYLRR